MFTCKPTLFMSGTSPSSAISLPKFYFVADLGLQGNMVFQEVTGLSADPNVIEYREGNNKVFEQVKMPGIMKFGNVTLKKGIFTADNQFWPWYNSIKVNTIARRNAVIKLVDETGETTMQWTLNNAFPVKITGTDLKTNANEVAIESLEIAHEGMVIG